MKTFLLNISKQIKNWSDSLDAKAVLCSRSWLVFNDEGVKEVYIFQNDGTLLASHNGKVTRANWEYLATNTAILIEQNNDTFMLKPFFYDNKVLALQLDGTNNFAFMIGENYVEELAIDNMEKASLYITNHDEFQKREQEKKIKKQEAEMLTRKEWENFIDQKVEEKMKTAEIIAIVEKNKKIKKRGLIISFVIMISFACIATIGTEMAIIIGILVASLALILFIMILFINENTTKYKLKFKLMLEFPYDDFKG